MNKDREVQGRKVECQGETDTKDLEDESRDSNGRQPQCPNEYARNSKDDGSNEIEHPAYQTPRGGGRVILERGCCLRQELCEGLGCAARARHNNTRCGSGFIKDRRRERVRDGCRCSSSLVAAHLVRWLEEGYPNQLRWRGSVSARMGACGGRNCGCRACVDQIADAFWRRAASRGVSCDDHLTPWFYYPKQRGIIC